MNGAWVFVLGLACGSVAIGWPRFEEHLHAIDGEQTAQSAAGSARAHTKEKFSITAQSPMERAAPLFGADQ